MSNTHKKAIWWAASALPACQRREVIHNSENFHTLAHSGPGPYSFIVFTNDKYIQIWSRYLRLVSTIPGLSHKLEFQTFLEGSSWIKNFFYKYNVKIAPIQSRALNVTAILIRVQLFQYHLSWVTFHSCILLNPLLRPPPENLADQIVINLACWNCQGVNSGAFWLPYHYHYYTTTRC